nr:septal ring lytic transglycosylase RlpA family protein [Phytohalomonas tamaricis]
MKSLFVVACVVLLAGCAGSGGGTQGSASSGSKGRYAVDKDGYPDASIDVSNVPDAVPKVEPLAKSGNRPTYQVWGKTYHVLSSSEGYANIGLASFYGTKFQGYATASGEPYDMYKMSAAHKSLPLPTYARVTNLDNNRSVIVKVNDRGPFHDDRLIDLSYAAASRLDMLAKGTARVRVEAIDPVAWQAGRSATQVVRKAQPLPSTEAVSAASTKTLAQTTVVNNKPSTQPATGISVSASAGSAGKNASGVPGVNKGEPTVYLQVAALGSAAGANALKAKLESQLSRPVRVSQHAAMHRVQIGPLSDPIMVESVKSELRDAGYERAFIVSASD